MNKSILTKLEGVPEKFLKGKKLVLTNGEIIICDQETSESFSIDKFLKNNQGDIRDFKLEILFND